MNEFVLMWKNIFDYKGRARRREYWMPYVWFTLIGVVEVILLCGAAVVVEVINELVGMIILIVLLFVVMIVNVALNVAFLSLTVRRYHDAGFSGWWLLLVNVLAVCGIGSIIHLVILCLDSKEDNQWGPNPKGIIYNYNGYQNNGNNHYFNGYQNNGNNNYSNDYQNNSNYNGYENGTDDFQQ